MRGTRGILENLHRSMEVFHSCQHATPDTIGPGGSRDPGLRCASALAQCGADGGGKSMAALPCVRVPDVSPRAVLRRVQYTRRSSDDLSRPDVCHPRCTGSEPSSHCCCANGVPAAAPTGGSCATGALLAWVYSAKASGMCSLKRLIRVSCPGCVERNS